MTAEKLAAALYDAIGIAGFEDSAPGTLYLGEPDKEGAPTNILIDGRINLVRVAEI